MCDDVGKVPGGGVAKGDDVMEDWGSRSRSPHQRLLIYIQDLILVYMPCRALLGPLYATYAFVLNELLGRFRRV